MRIESEAGLRVGMAFGNGTGPGTTAQIRQASFSERNVRRLNVGVAVGGLLITLPLMMLIALVVWSTSPGPILHSQERVGRDRRRGERRGRGDGKRELDAGRRRRCTGGQIFTMYKFRTMRTPVKGSASREVWASPDDRRITPVGSVLRAYRLDELPQLFNVLRGDMNVVGPRPEQPAIFQELRGQVEGYPKRQVVLPGITGWAQVNHPYDQSLDDVRRKVELDLAYIRRRSPAEDLRIMARTLPVMVGRQGAL
jgi:lipopolysaccharide/colanic/teichoic acid biosynthesis glycosyltransferase